MISWLTFLLIYEYYFNKCYKVSTYINIFIYFVIATLLSKISMHFFPLSGDEVLYNTCGTNIYNLIKGGHFFNPPMSACTAISNYFAQSLGYIFLTGSGTYSGLISMNIALIYVATDLITKTITTSKMASNRLFYLILFSPPTLYLTLRPAKEASIAFIFSFVSFAVSNKSFKLKSYLVLSSLFLAYLLRWQLIGGIILSLGFLWFWRQSLKFDLLRFRKLVAFFAILIPVWLIIRPHVISSLNVHLHKDNVHQFSITPQSAIIYKFMLNNKQDNSLSEWNVIVAHLGGVLTPHPFRVFKEYSKTKKWQPHIVEEFVYVTFWIFACYPLMVLAFHDLFIKNVEKPTNVRPVNIFKFTLAFFIFSTASLSTLYHTPQMFRYKIPLNIYFVSLVGTIIIKPDLLTKLKSKGFLVGTSLYFLFMIAYIVLYLSFPIS